MVLASVAKDMSDTQEPNDRMQKVTFRCTRLLGRCSGGRGAMPAAM